MTVDRSDQSTSPGALEQARNIASNFGQQAFDFVIGDAIKDGQQAISDFREGNIGSGLLNAGSAALNVLPQGKALKIGRKLFSKLGGDKLLKGWERFGGKKGPEGPKKPGKPDEDPKSIASHERLKDDLRAQMGRPKVHDPKLDKIIGENYREGAKVGSGSTADAVRHELKTGERVGGRLHDQKARDTITTLEKWLKNNPSARPGDRAAAENVLKDLQNSLSGK